MPRFLISLPEQERAWRQNIRSSSRRAWPRAGAGEAAPAALREVSALGAFLETHARPELGAWVELRHPEAGSISGEVRTLAPDGIAIAFSHGERSVAFALAAIAADMSRPAA